MGYALALGIPSKYFTPEGVHLPYMLKKAAEVHKHVFSYQYKDIQNLLTIQQKIFK